MSSRLRVRKPDPGSREGARDDGPFGSVGSPRVDAEGEADVVVVGGGPAGSTVARLVAGAGLRVVVLDRATFPRPKPCGECLNPGAVAALDRLGLLPTVLAAVPGEIRGWEVRTGGGAGAVGIFPPGEGALGIRRGVLDDLLLRAAVESGADVRQGQTVVDLDPGGDAEPARVVARDGVGRVTRWTGAVVVGADGLRSVVARRLGLPARPPRVRKLSLTAHVLGRGPSPDRGRLHVSEGGVVGLAPVHGLEPVWNVTVVVDAGRRGREVAGGAAAFLMDALERSGAGFRGAVELVDGPWASGPFDWPMRRPYHGRVVLVGDAAGYYDPFTGQGIYRALRSAELAAATILEARSARPPGKLRSGSYGGRLQSALGPGRAVQGVIEKILSRSWSRNLAVAFLGRRPAVMAALIRVTGDARPVRSLLAPAPWLATAPGEGGDRRQDDSRGTSEVPGSDRGSARGARRGPGRTGAPSPLPEASP